MTAQRIGPSLACECPGKIWFNPLCLVTGKEWQQRGLDQILARECPGKIWSNPLCCHVLGHLWEMTALRIGPNFACECPGKIWFNPLVTGRE